MGLFNNGLFKKRKIVLALGGGSARGLSSIGVLKVLERHIGRENLPFDMIIGTSIGSLIGAAYCAGRPLSELEEKASCFNWGTLVDLGLHKTGLMKGDKLEKAIITMVDSIGFEDLRMPFGLTTTNLLSGQELLHTSGDLIKLIRASCSWPGFFTSVEIDGQLLADGGLRNSVPSKAAYDCGASFVVAVDPGFAISNQKIDNVFKALVQSIQIMGEELNAYQSSSADIAIKPDLGEIGQFDFDKSAQVIRQGEIAAEKCIKDLKKRLFFDIKMRKSKKYWARD